MISILVGYPPYFLRTPGLREVLFQAIVLVFSRISLGRMMGLADRISKPHF
jgi:hypothetical protein